MREPRGSRQHLLRRLHPRPVINTIGIPMPLKSAKELLQNALANGYALGYFESWNLESLQGVIDAAEATGSPILIGFNGEFLSHPERLARERLAWYAALGQAAAASALVPCALIFNECAQDSWIREAVTSGFSQVMLDDPAASRPEYLQRLQALTAHAHAHGVAMEAEAGQLPSGAQGGIEEAGASPTDPEIAARLVRETGIDILAVSVGNVHVLLDGEKGLDLDRLAAIAALVDIPLDLHGGTGIAADYLRRAIALGVAKVCYGTYVKQRYLEAVRAALADDETNPHLILGCGGKEDAMVAGRLAVRDAVLERIELLGCCGRA
jgi:ketose-bisphosphate aldolase